MAASEADLHNQLVSYSTKKYNIEYEGFLTNHLAHGLIALYKLGASKERLEQFTTLYIPRLEDAETTQDDTGDVSEDVSSDVLLGKRVLFNSIVTQFEKKLSSQYEENLEEMINAEFPSLAHGLSGAAFHGLIELGYGFSVKNSRIVCEGLAYLHHSYKPLKYTGSLGDNSLFGRGQRNILSVLEEVRANKDLFHTMMEGGDTKEFMDLNTGRFQRRLTYLCRYKGDYLVGLLQSLSVPENIRKPESHQEYDIVKLGQWIVDIAVTAFVMSSRTNDFFLLHGVTSAWALLQVLPVLKSYQDQLDAVRVFLCCLVGTYLANGAQPLDVPFGGGDSPNPDWGSLLETTLNRDLDEHIYKLVQVCAEMKNVCKENDALYYKAATIALQNELTFF